MIGFLAVSLFLAAASYFDIKTAGEKIPLNLLRGWLAASVAYACYAAYELLNAEAFAILQAWGITILAASLIAFTLQRLRLSGEADCWALVSTTIFSPFVALQSFLLAAIPFLAVYGVPLFALNMTRKERAVPWWAYTECIRLTPRLSRIKFVRWRKVRGGRFLLTAPDAEEVPLNAHVGDLAAPFRIFLPFYLVTFAAALIPSVLALYACWVGVSPALLGWLLSKLP